MEVHPFEDFLDQHLDEIQAWLQVSSLTLDNSIQVGTLDGIIEGELFSSIQSFMNKGNWVGTLDGIIEGELFSNILSFMNEGSHIHESK